MTTLATHSRNGKVRVLQFAGSSATFQFVYPLMRALVEDGFSVMAAAKQEGKSLPFESIGVTAFDLPVPRRLSPLAILKAVFATASLLRRHSVDIIQAHTYAGGMIGRLAGWVARTPVVIYTGHGWLYTPDTPPLKKWVIRFTERLFKHLTDWFFLIGQEEYEVGLQDRILCPGNSVLAHSVGVDCDQFDPVAVPHETRQRLRREFGVQEDQCLWTFVGRLVEEKGLLELGQAFAGLWREVPAVRLLIVGSVGASERDQTCKQKLLSQLERDGCREAVIFAGQRRDIRDILATSDAFVLPTYREGMPVSLLEAMAMELPCIGTDIPGCREEIVDGQCGYLVPARQVEPLRSRMRDLLSDRQRAVQLGRAARQRVLEMFSLSRVLEIQLDAYRRIREDLLRKRASRRNGASWAQS
ncbi:MAG TPA: hypothetical protein DCX07_08700 [Phycisphaerales bacterium]|nr:hypothetical protein [Phycisphaerales bacterium]